MRARNASYPSLSLPDNKVRKHGMRAMWLPVSFWVFSVVLLLTFLCSSQFYVSLHLRNYLLPELDQRHLKLDHDCVTTFDQEVPSDDSEQRDLLYERSNSKPEKFQWPHKMGTCSPGGWPVEMLLGSQGAAVQVLAMEAEKTDDNKLSVLLTAFSEESNATTTELLERVLPLLRCDFRKGGIAATTLNDPVYRAHVQLSIMQEEEKLGSSIAAKITCDLPPTSVFDKDHAEFLRKSKDGEGPKSGPNTQLLLPKIHKLSEMTKAQRQLDENYKWLHWHLVLLQNDTDDTTTSAKKSWLASTSLPLCDLDHVEGSWSTARNSYPTADDYGPRGWNATKDPPGWLSSALCVAPRRSTSSLDAWIESSTIDEWAHYQHSIVGFSVIFYLDPFGEELTIRRPEVAADHLMVHVPHTARLSSLASSVDTGAVADALARERCEMLSRRYWMDFVMVLENPMDLIVPLKRQRFTLPRALSETVESGCADSVWVPQVPWLFDHNVPASEKIDCDAEWCDLPVASASMGQFLLDAGPAEHEATSWLPIWSTKTQSPCAEKKVLPDQTLQAVSWIGKTETASPSDAEELQKLTSLRRVYSGVAVWVRHALQIKRVQTLSDRLRYQRSLPQERWVSSSRSQVHMCRAKSDAGPIYGEAIVRRSSEIESRLTFFNAEVHNTSADGGPVVSFSTYAEDRSSIGESLSSDYAWGMLLEADVSETLRDVACVFYHPDSHQRLAGKTFRSPARWKYYENVLLWLECPLPESLPLLDDSELSWLVTIDLSSAASSSDLDVRMIRPMQLCIGVEKKEMDDSRREEKLCDSVSAACQVGCIDDLKSISDPQARCCNRCHKPDDRYQRFDERDFWTPVSALTNANLTSGDGLDGQNTSGNLPNGDLSICLRPFFLDTLRSDAIDPFSSQRLVEWIEYHLLIGFDVIYVLDRYGDLLLPLLRPYIEAGRVIHKPFPLLTDVGLSPEGRSESAKITFSAQDQHHAYDYCLSIARRRNDLFTAFTDLDEFITYPEPRAGMVRSVIGNLLSGNQSSLPDSIVLDRFDVETESDGFALQYTRRNQKPRKHGFRGGKAVPQQHGKVLANPQALRHGAIMIHSACSAPSKCGAYGTNSVVSPFHKLSIKHYRKYNAKSESFKIQKTQTGIDSSLQWAHDILSTQFIVSHGWNAIKNLSRQGLLQINSMRSRSQEITELPKLFIGILSYCSDRDRRDAVRSTWLSSDVLQKVQSMAHVEWKFILGQHPQSERSAACLSSSLEAESLEFGDLAILDNLAENYQILSRKTLAMFKWASEHVDADFVFKTDDDSYLNLAGLVADLAQVESPNTPLYWGHHQSLTPWLSADYNIAPKWYLKPEDLPRDTQTYATGAGYMLSRPLVRHLAGMFEDHGASLQLPWGKEERLGWLEDATIGYLLRGAVNRGGRVDAFGKIWDVWFEFACDDTYVLHHLSASQQTSVHSLMFPGRALNNQECEELLNFRGSMPMSPSAQRISSTMWGSSSLDMSVSPLQVAAPPKVAQGVTIAAPNGRDVIVVTGGLHNIGRTLVEKIQEGHSGMSGPITVLVLDSANHDGFMFASPRNSIPGLIVETVVEQVDITDLKALKSSLMPYVHRIRGVVHLAAVARVQDCHADQKRCKEVNVDGTKNVLSAMWTLLGQSVGASDRAMLTGQRPLPWLIFASSREVYGALDPNEVAHETSVLRPLNIYGETKLRAEMLIERWTRNTGFNAAILRFTNVYGSCHDHSLRLVPNLSSRLSSGRDFEIFGTANKTISLLHVNDVVEAIFRASGYLETIDNGAGYSDAFNIGGGADHDVLALKDIVRISKLAFKSIVPSCKFCHVSKNLHVTDTTSLDRSPEPEHFRASISKAFRVFGYQASKTFEEATMRDYIRSCIVLEDATTPSSMTSLRKRAYS